MFIIEIHDNQIRFDASISSAIILDWSVGSLDPAAGSAEGCLPFKRFWGAGFGVPFGGDSGGASLLLAAAAFGFAFAFPLASLISASDASAKVEKRKKCRLEAGPGNINQRGF